MKRKPLTFEEHRELGIKLWNIHNEMVSISTMLGCRYPKNGKISKLADLAVRGVGNLRSELDEQVCLDCPDRIYDKSHCLYYGAEGKKKK